MSTVGSDRSRVPDRKSQHRTSRRAASFACALLLSIVASVATEVSPAAASPQITGTGSSFAALAIRQWASDLDSLGLNVNYATASSVIGLNQFAARSVDFGASEIGYSTNQASPPNFPYQYLPDVSGGIAFAYNLTDNNGQRLTNLRLSPSTLIGIWTDKILKWDDPAVKADNPGVALPDTPVTVVYRSDGAGESYILTDYFNYLFHAQWIAYLQAIHESGAPLTAYYPVAQPGTPLPPGYNFDNWLGQSGSESAAHYVSQSGSDGAITYVETSWALTYNIPVAFVKNPSGSYVQPTSLNVATALEKALLYADLEEDLRGVYTNSLPNSYPLSSYSYVITQTTGSDPSKGAALSQFIYFLACAGQSQMIQLGYSPLPPNLVQTDFAAAQRINGHAAAPPIDAAHCKNPYVDGQVPLPGEPSLVGGGGGPTTTVPNPGGTTGPVTPGSTAPSTGPIGSTSGGGAKGSTTGPATTPNTNATTSNTLPGAGSTGNGGGSQSSASGPGGATEVASGHLSTELASAAHSITHSSGPGPTMLWWVFGLLLVCLAPLVLVPLRRARRLVNRRSPS
jgi:phosphate transport system substrate-binding protein